MAYLGAIAQQNGLTGNYAYLILTNADTLPGGVGPGQSYFSNIRLYEAAGSSVVATTTHIYDDSGRLRSSTDALERCTRYEYDSAARLAKTVFPDSTSTTQEYDDDGNCISVPDEIGRTTRYVYDDRNRRIKAILDDGSSART